MKSNMPYNLSIVNLQLRYLFLKVSFDCRIKAIVEYNTKKKNTSSVRFNPHENKAVFNQIVKLDNLYSAKNFLKITLIILKNNSTKMVGKVLINLDDDPIKEAGNFEYFLKRCPLKNVKLVLDYEYKPAKNIMHKTIDIHSLMNNQRGTGYIILIKRNYF